jgi:tetratricopeptide (TPR) repeat protein
MDCSSLVIFITLIGEQTANATPKSALNSFERLARQATAARDARHLDQAAALYQRALRLRPAWAEGWWNLGSIAYDQDDFPSCALAFAKLVHLKPEDTRAWTMHGLCAYRLRDYDAALRSLLRTERQGFKEDMALSRAARLHLALLLNRHGAFERSLLILNELIRIGGKSAEVSAAAGIAGLRRRWLPHEVPERSQSAVLELGDAMVSAMEQDQAAARRKFESAAPHLANEPNFHYRFGAFLMLQEPDRGIAEIRKALELDPEHVPALVGLAMIYLKRGDLADAREFGEQAVKVAPDDFSTHATLGRVLLMTEDKPGDAAAAARELEAAVKLAPANPEVRFSLASAYSRLGRKADAARELAEFQRLKKLIDSSQP